VTSLSTCHTSLVIKSIHLILMHYQKVDIRWQSKKLQIQGAQVLRNEAYLPYAAVTKDAAQRRSWTFYKAINNEVEISDINMIKI
ncbi:MAG: hypothetical protein U9R24_07660, partial [Thermodesulfobacteriota bacterium]|nr:hypothetical protein [Thermodesulfobacteriota bacterium]